MKGKFGLALLLIFGASAEAGASPHETLLIEGCGQSKKAAKSKAKLRTNELAKEYKVECESTGGTFV